MSNYKVWYVQILTIMVCMGCATTTSRTAGPLKAEVGKDLDLSKYDIATFEDFAVNQKKDIDPSVGHDFATRIYERVKYDFGDLFTEVRQGECQKEDGEVSISGYIRVYQPGNRFARFMLIGAGAASFQAELHIKDAKTDELLLSAPIHELWAWGGLLGGSKDIEDMVNESAARSANTIARAKGWNPDSTKDNE